MIDRNLALKKIGETYFVQFESFDNDELNLLFVKHKGTVNVQIRKPASLKTENQNNALHSLLLAYWLTGMHSAPEYFRKSYLLFRLHFKLSYGPCYNTVHNGKEVKIPKSIADYTKEEMAAILAAAITEIHETGAYASSKDLQKIIAGMDSEERR